MDQLTVLIITFNEEANIRRTLDSIHWAKQILVVDSFSTDRTMDILQSDARVKVVQRQFKDFADQCNYGLSLICTPWTLSIDADYVFPTDSQRLIEAAMRGTCSAYQAGFDYWIHGKAVRGSILPGRTVLYQTDKAQYFKDGHGHRVNIDGSTGSIPLHIAHDDRKPFIRWCHSQVNYARDETHKLLSMPVSDLGRNDRIRRMIVIAPILVFVLCYIVRGGFLSGWRGLFYAGQRFFAELLLSLFLLDRRISSNSDSKKLERESD